MSILKFKKGKLTVLAVAGLVAACLTGCGADSGDYSRYVTLGDYQSLKATMMVQTVTDEELEATVRDQLTEYQILTDKQDAIEQDDYVKLGIMVSDGAETVYDFTDEEGYEITVGNAEFGQEFDAELIGAKPGDSLNFDIMYDADFEDGMLAGKDISYQVDVRAVWSVADPELTDEFVKNNFEVSSVKVWKQALREQLQQEYEAEAEDEVRADLLKQVVAASEIRGYPKSLYKQQKEMIDEEYQGYADMFGCSLDDIYEMLEMDDKELKKQYLDATNEAMVLAELCKKEQLTMDEEELQQRLEEYAEENEYGSVAELLEDYTEESLKVYFQNEKVLDYLEAHADITRQETTAE